MIEKALAELTLNITDGKHGDCRGKDDSGYYFISCKDIREGQIHYEDARQIIEEDFWDTHKRTRLEPDDILVTNSGTIGRMAFVRDVPLTYRTTFQKSVAIVKPDKAKIFPKYLYYQLQNCVDDFINRSNGAAQKNLLLSTMRAFKMNIHEDEDLQMHIAAILSAYDDLIENNQKQIKLLEEAAQRLYKEWFVDLRFPGHENTKIVDGIPEGWKKCFLSDIIGYEIGGGWGEEKPTERCDIPAYVIRGTDLYGITHGDSMGIPYRYHEKKNLDARRLVDGDIVFEVSGGSKTEGVARTTLIRSAMLEQWREPVMCASFCKLIRVKEPKYAQLLFDAFRYMRASGKTAEYDKRSASSIVNYRWKDFLATETVLVPDELTLEKYNALADNMYQLTVQKSISIGKAKDARDRLLPKLMSGEIEV